MDRDMLYLVVVLKVLLYRIWTYLIDIITLKAQKPRLKPQAKRARLDALRALKRKLKARG